MDRGAWWATWGPKELDTTEVTVHACETCLKLCVPRLSTAPIICLLKILFDKKYSATRASQAGLVIKHLPANTEA